MSITIQATSGKDYFLRAFYGDKSATRTKTGRTGISGNVKSSADASALKNALKELKKVDYDNTEKDGDLYNKMLAFVDTYNNTMESSSENGTDESVQRRCKNMKQITKKYEKELKDLGINIQSDGTMKLVSNSKDKFSISKMQKLFSKTNGTYSASLLQCAKRMNTEAETAIMSTSGHFDAKV